MRVSTSTHLVSAQEKTPQANHPQPDFLAPQEEKPTQIGLDPLDEATLRNLDPRVFASTEKTLVMTVTDLFREGGRGAAARRLLARDIALSRVRLRCFESILSVAFEKYIHGALSDRRLKTIEKLVDGQHRRLLSALELLRRLDAPTAAIRITADQAAVVVGRQ